MSKEPVACEQGTLNKMTAVARMPAPDSTEQAKGAEGCGVSDSAEQASKQ